MVEASNRCDMGTHVKCATNHIPPCVLRSPLQGFSLLGLGPAYLFTYVQIYVDREDAYGSYLETFDAVIRMYWTELYWTETDIN
ncbi:unnamed protein product [Lactuca virosa]|uniref:Uncharacterized protein n=1 Tax=Lactuca virosa TaxID=75947 RepID=A0AAU9MIN2_9ASTR|nr:unnamed protein product [Lactuca virosa]